MTNKSPTLKPKEKKIRSELKKLLDDIEKQKKISTLFKKMFNSKDMTVKEFVKLNRELAVLMEKTYHDQ